MIATRRSLITGIGALLCAPAIVRAGSLMPISAWREPAPAFKPYVYVSNSSASPNVFCYPTKEHFSTGDLVYLGNDGYAYRHDSDRCQPVDQFLRNSCLGVAVL